MQISGFLSNPKSQIRLLSPIVLAVSVSCSPPADGSVVGSPASTVASMKQDELMPAFKAIKASGFTGLVMIQAGDSRPIMASFGEVTPTGRADADTLVDVASIAKTVTATMVMKLVEDGDLQTDVKLDEIFSNVPADKAGITIHHLLTHSSGLPEAIGPDHELISRDEFLDQLFATPLQTAPGDTYAYSNTGYSLLAAIIEEKTGQTYENILQERILKPAGVTDIGYLDAYDADRAMLNENGETIPQSSWGGNHVGWNLKGNGGLLMSPNGFLAFYKALDSGKILSDKMLMQLRTPHIIEGPGAPSHYGYGVVVEDNSQLGRFYWHNGGTSGGFSANWTAIPGKDALIFVAGNRTSETADDAVMKVIKILVASQ